LYTSCFFLCGGDELVGIMVQYAGGTIQDVKQQQQHSENRVDKKQMNRRKERREKEEEKEKKRVQRRSIAEANTNVPNSMNVEMTDEEKAQANR